MRQRIDNWVKGCLLLLVATLSILPLSGEPQDGYIVSYLNLNTGMPANYVDDIYRDSHGFIWISTHGSGLLRYDGYSYMNFGLSGNLGISMSSNSCHNVVEDHFGRLWIAFEEGTKCLDMVNGSTQLPKSTSKRTEDILKRIAMTSCMRVYCDAKGNIWILTVSELCRVSFDADGNVATALVTPHQTKVPDLAMEDLDRDGSVYVGLGLHLNKVFVQGGHLVVKNLAARYPQLNGKIIGAMVKWNGHAWFGTNHGLYNDTFKDPGLHFSATGNGLQHETVTSLATSYNKGGLVIGTLGGVDFLSRNDTFSGHWNSTRATNALSGDFVNCVYTFGQQLWIGTENGGITQLKPRFLNIVNFVHDNASVGSLSSGAVNAMYESPTGDLWVGTVEGGLNLLRKGAHDFVHFTASNSGLPHNTVSVLTPDGAGNIWIGTWGGGVAVSSQGSIHPLVTDAAHATDLLFIGAMAYDPYNRGMWIGANAGLFFYDFKTHRLRDPFPQCRTINGAIGSLVTRDGKLFMGCLPGMVVVDLKKGPNRKGQFAFTHYIYKFDNPSSRAYEKVTSFFQTSDGTIWIGSNGDGIYRMKGTVPDSASVKCFTISDGLANNGVVGLAEDNRGLLWIATNDGLSCINPRTETFDNFTVADGLLSNQFYFNGLIKGDNGKIWLGSDKGLTLLRGMNRIVEDPVRLTFTALYVNNHYVKAGSAYLKEDIALSKEIHLHESDRSFVIDFSTLSYDGDSQGAFAYRMKGYEDDWIPLPVGEHSIRYSMLPAGHYTFEVRYTPPMGTGKVQIASVGVSVTPYFWKSWWFLSLLAILLSFLAFKVYKYRMKLMRDKVTVQLYRPIEAALKDSSEPELLESRIQTILQNEKLYQQSQKQSIDKDKSEVQEKEVPFMDRIMKVMEENYANPDLNVMMIAEAMGMQRTEVSKQLQSNVGVTTSQFIRNYRLDLAKKMLEDNVADRNITEIAFRVGFNDPKYFTRCFSQRFGVAPSAYKKS
jgi:ligand-binding sensor domain-containing protein/AraC-like DNA-binding protein